MISISSTQLDAWFALFIWPFMRITALMLSEPVLGNQAIPRRIRVAISVILTLTIAPLLPTPPVVNFVSAQGLLIAAQQLLIGVTLGLSMRMVLNGIEMAGHIAGLSMGLGFATFFDPQNGAQSVVIAQFLGIFAMLIFFALNGHLMVISALYESFQVLPISSAPLNALGFLAVAEAGAQMFLVGFMLSLPLLAAILIANIALGVLARAAPQLNLFAVGFPLTITAGFVMLMMSLPYSLPPISRLMEEAALHGLKLIGVLHGP
jgi:flagellar biosynthetic protein FliR